MILKENDTQLYITDAEVCQKLNVLKCYQFNVAIKLKFEFKYFGNFDSNFWLVETRLQLWEGISF